MTKQCLCFSGQRVGVIVRLEKENFQVLDMFGKQVSLRHNSVNKKRENRNAMALDAENNNIQVKDIVKVIDGPHSVRMCSRQILWHSFV